MVVVNCLFLFAGGCVCAAGGWPEAASVGHLTDYVVWARSCT